VSRPAHDVVVIGGGLFGLVFARQLVTLTEASVLIAEATDHLGGLAWSRQDAATGVEYNPHGTHVLATGDPGVRAYLRKFVDLMAYRHVVYAQVDGDLVAMPVGLEAIGKCYGRVVDADEARALIEHDTAPFRNRLIQSVADAARATVGPRLYEMFVAGHVEKQWGRPADQLEPDVFTRRFPIRYQSESSYFPPEQWQGLPAGGYSALCTALAGHERIEVAFGCRIPLIDQCPRFRRLCVVTSPIDEYLGYRFGPLDRRTIVIDWRQVDVAGAPTHAVVTHPDRSVPYYRTHVPALLPWNSMPTTGPVLVGYEHAGTGEHSTSFVVRSAANAALAERYRQLARECPRHLFAGRGTTYYDDMGTTIGAALTAARTASTRVRAGL
jgi:UDP-galactopyranose mutase